MGANLSKASTYVLQIGGPSLNINLFSKMGAMALPVMGYKIRQLMRLRDGPPAYIV